MKALDTFKSWVGEFIELALMLISVGVLVQILFGKDVMFFSNITENLMAFITPAEAAEYAKLVDADPRGPRFTERQAQAIIELQLQRLTGMEQQKILDELAELLQLIERLLAILSSDRLVMQIATSEQSEVRLALTRRFVKLLWPLLVRLAEAASPRIRTQANPEARKALLGLEHQQAVTRADLGPAGADLASFAAALFLDPDEVAGEH